MGANENNQNKSDSVYNLLLEVLTQLLTVKELSCKLQFRHVGSLIKLLHRFSSVNRHGEFEMKNEQSTQDLQKLKIKIWVVTDGEANVSNNRVDSKKADYVVSGALSYIEENCNIEGLNEPFTSASKLQQTSFY